MKTKIIIKAVASVFLANSAFCSLVFAVEPSAAIADHMAAANYYDQKAAEQEAAIAQHEEMKKDCHHRFFVNEGVTPESQIKEIENHCDAIIKAANGLKDAYRSAAKAHRLHAYSIEGALEKEQNLETRRRLA